MRQYYPEEDDPFHTKYLIYQDKNGTTIYEDLTLEVPESRASIKDVSFYLYTRKNMQNGVRFKMGEASQLILSEFYDPTKPNFFIIHGWNNNYKSELAQSLTPAILAKSDMNVFVVDWSGPATGFYSLAKSAVPKVGKWIGQFIVSMMDIFKIPPSNIRMTGHSLGAHVAGCAGAEIGGTIDFIVGLDPASPLFTIKDKATRLDESDAKFVQIIHTSTTIVGFKSSIGHVDIFPNRGYSQPGCGIDLFYVCSHSRAYEFYAESVLTGGFASKECDDYKSYKAGLCEDNHQTYMGGLELDKR